MNERDGNTQDRRAGRDVVLVVDDEAINQMVLTAVLDPDYRVLSAISGLEALEMARGSPRPDLILLDVMMPDMDGLEVLARLRADEATRDIPVILVTALVDDEHEQTGFEAGAADYIHKPIRIPIVQARVRAQLDAKSARDMLFKNNLHLRHKVEGGVRALETAQMQLMQAEKMASLGQLAAGIAHEINNPIGFVSSNLGTLKDYHKTMVALLDACRAGRATEADFAAADFDYLKADLADLMRESRDGLERVRKIVADLKDFSRLDQADWQEADLNAGIECTLNVVRNEIKYKAEVVREYDAKLPPVRCLPAQINQVVMNLLVNAAHAIEERGIITVRSGHDAGWAWIEVADTGRGMSPEVLKCIFDPFYTTKPVGKGTGLGLSTCYGIVKQSGGFIEVESKPGRGGRRPRKAVAADSAPEDRTQVQPSVDLPEDGREAGAETTSRHHRRDLRPRRHLLRPRFLQRPFAHFAARVERRSERGHRRRFLPSSHR